MTNDVPHVIVEDVSNSNLEIEMKVMIHAIQEWLKAFLEIKIN